MIPAKQHLPVSVPQPSPLEELRQARRDVLRVERNTGKPNFNFVYRVDCWERWNDAVKRFNEQRKEGA